MIFPVSSSIRAAVAGLFSLSSSMRRMEEMTVEEAKAQGATGLFASKYGERVKVYTVGEFSKEICGGPHASRSGELGTFVITKEQSSSSGVRRIKAELKK